MATVDAARDTIQGMNIAISMAGKKCLKCLQLPKITRDFYSMGFALSCKCGLSHQFQEPGLHGDFKSNNEEMASLLLKAVKDWNSENTPTIQTPGNTTGLIQ